MRLIVELPFGCPADPPPPVPPRNEVLPGVAPDAPLLYFGGVYDWYDPLTVLAALPDACLGADVIVGFPGEREADFDLTMKLVDGITLQDVIRRHHGGGSSTAGTAATSSGWVRA